MRMTSGALFQLSLGEIEVNKNRTPLLLPKRSRGVQETVKRENFKYIVYFINKFVKFYDI
jgi:hypothetical protein